MRDKKKGGEKQNCPPRINVLDFNDCLTLAFAPNSGQTLIFLSNKTLLFSVQNICSGILKEKNIHNFLWHFY